jgi:hypothetical protein
MSLVSDKELNIRFVASNISAAANSASQIQNKHMSSIDPGHPSPSAMETKVYRLHSQLFIPI